MDFTPYLVERFWARVDKSGECWLWTGQMHRTTPVLWQKDAGLSALRVSYQIAHGVEPPRDKMVVHSCASVTCVRPDHLYLAKGTRMNAGEHNVAWKGDAATTLVKRKRAVRRYPLGPCQHEGCDAWASDRHHIDGNTGNNDPSNIRLLCRRHHMIEDGRLQKLAALNPPKKPPQPCVECGRLSRLRTHGLCTRCHSHHYYHYKANGVIPPWKRAS